MRLIVQLGGRRFLQPVQWVEIQRHGGGGDFVASRSSATLCGGWKDVGTFFITSSIETTAYQENAPLTSVPVVSDLVPRCTYEQRSFVQSADFAKAEEIWPVKPSQQ